MRIAGWYRRPLLVLQRLQSQFAVRALSATELAPYSDPIENEYPEPFMNALPNTAIRHPAPYAPSRAPMGYDAMVLASKRRAIELRRQELNAALTAAGCFVLRSLHLCEEVSARAMRRWMPQG